MNTVIKNICRYEGLNTVKKFRDFFEYWFIGAGEMDDDFAEETKIIYRSRSVSEWKKLYSELTDEVISESLATEKETVEAQEAWKVRISETRDSGKSEEEKKAENLVATEMQDAGLDYDVHKTWEENIAENANNPEVKTEEIRSLAWGGARKGAGRKQKNVSGKATTVSFCCSPEQKEKLQEEVKKSGMKQSEYIVSKLF